MPLPLPLHAGVRRVNEVEQHWEKRLRDGMAACERKFTEEYGESVWGERMVWGGRRRSVVRGRGGSTVRGGPS